MTTDSKKRHLYYDQQQPLEGDPVDSGHSRVTQDAFAKNPPTAEDNYFHDEEKKRLHPPHSEAPDVPTPTAVPTEPKGFLDRIYRALTRGFNPKWRP